MGLKLFGLGTQGCGVGLIQAITLCRDAVDQAPLTHRIVIVRPGNAHQKRGQRKAGIVVGHRIGLGLRQPLEEITKHILRYSPAAGKGQSAFARDKKGGSERIQRIGAGGGHVIVRQTKRSLNGDKLNFLVIIARAVR